MAEIEEGCRLKDLLPRNLGAFEETLEEELKKEGKSGHSRLAWRFIRSSASDELRNALDCDVFSLLAGAWGKVRELRKYTEASGYPKDQTAIVHLQDHKLPLKVEPVLTVQVGTLPLLALRFTLEVASHFDAAALSIRNGHIVSIAPGDAWLSAQLKYKGKALHAAQECPKVKLPGLVRLSDPGLKIG